MSDTIFLKLKHKVDDVYSVPPTAFGDSVLTSLFRQTTGKLKFFPFKVIIPVSIVAAIFLYAIVGFLIVRLVSILQFGF